MVPSAATVVRLRYFVRVGLRCAGVGMLIYACLSLTTLTSSLLGAMTSGGLDITGLTVELLGKLSPVGPGLVLIWLSTRIARWLVPLPRARCPQCDYSLFGVTEGRCPECGLYLEAALLGRPAAQARAQTQPSPQPVPPRPAPSTRPSAAP